jgi:hypothetical protein
LNLPGYGNVVLEFMLDMKENVAQLRKTMVINHGEEYPTRGMMKTIPIPTLVAVNPIPIPTHGNPIPILKKLNLSGTVVLPYMIQMETFTPFLLIYPESTISQCNIVGALGTSPMMSSC